MGALKGEGFWKSSSASTPPHRLLDDPVRVGVERVLARLPGFVLLLAHLPSVSVEVQLVVVVQTAIPQVVEATAHHLLGFRVDLGPESAIAELLLLHLHLDLRELAVLLANLRAVAELLPGSLRALEVLGVGADLGLHRHLFQFVSLALLSSAAGILLPRLHALRGFRVEALVVRGVLARGAVAHELAGYLGHDALAGVLRGLRSHDLALLLLLLNRSLALLLLHRLGVELIENLPRGLELVVGVLLLVFLSKLLDVFFKLLALTGSRTEDELFRLGRHVPHPVVENEPILAVLAKREPLALELARLLLFHLIAIVLAVVGGGEGAVLLTLRFVLELEHSGKFSLGQHSVAVAVPSPQKLRQRIPLDHHLVRLRVEYDDRGQPEHANRLGGFEQCFLEFRDAHVAVSVLVQALEELRRHLFFLPSRLLRLGLLPRGVDLAVRNLRAGLGDVGGLALGLVECLRELDREGHHDRLRESLVRAELPRELDRVLAVPDLHALVRAGAEVHLDGRRDFPVRCRRGGGE